MRPSSVALLGALVLAPFPVRAGGQSVAAQTDPAPRAEVLVLGAYHMANPGRDIFNTQADDVLAPKRQAEIAQLLEVLRRFQPTRIAVEASFSSDVTATRYQAYVTGTHQLSRNETEQIGFRLAKQLGHETVFAVDMDGEFPFPRLRDYAKAHDRMPEFDALMEETGARVRSQSAYLASHTVLETLLLMNADDHVAVDVGFYYRLAHFGEPWNWAGADLISDWFRRNMRIYSNVVRLIESPNERILVVFGAGHLGWLRHAFASDPTIRVRRLHEFAR